MPTEKELLFLLPAAFPDAKQGTGNFFCPDCVTMQGLLAYHPHLLEKLEVKVLDEPVASDHRPVSAILEPVGP